MPQKIIISVVALIALSSCSKKDWTCTCTVNGTDYQKSISKTTNPKANSECGEYGKQIGESYYYGNYTYKCTVK